MRGCGCLIRILTLQSWKSSFQSGSICFTPNVATTPSEMAIHLSLCRSRKVDWKTFWAFWINKLYWRIWLGNGILAEKVHVLYERCKFDSKHLSQIWSENECRYQFLIYSADLLWCYCLTFVTLNSQLRLFIYENFYMYRPFYWNIWCVKLDLIYIYERTKR